MHCTRIAKAKLELGWMRIDVDQAWVEGQVEQITGVTAVIEHIAIAKSHGIA
jgi:hypothetical protein